MSNNVSNSRSSKVRASPEQCSKGPISAVVNDNDKKTRFIRNNSCVTALVKKTTPAPAAVRLVKGNIGGGYVFLRGYTK